MFIPTAAQVSRFAAFSGARAGLTIGTDSIPDSINTDVDWDTEFFDTDDYYTLAAPAQFTIPQAGKYLLGAWLLISSGATDWDQVNVYIEVDADFTIADWAPPNRPDIDQAWTAIVETLYEFTAGQAVKVRMHQSHVVPATADVSGGSFWIMRA